MSLADWFRRHFLDVEHAIERAGEDVIHFVEKEISMVSQAFQTALDHIKAALAGASDQVAALKKQVGDLTAAGADKDAQIASLNAANADLTQKLADATQQISDMEAALIAADPTVPAQ